jgi:hypothetical protein
MPEKESNAARSSSSEVKAWVVTRVLPSNTPAFIRVLPKSSTKFIGVKDKGFGGAEEKAKS